MEKAKKKISKEVKIGIFSIAMLVGVYWGINFLKGTELFSASHKYHAIYEQVSGLQVSAPVFIKGFKVGTISNMTYDPRDSENIVIEFSIKSKYRIPVDSEARIFSDGLMGGKSVQILLGKSDKYLEDGDSLVSSEEKDILELAGNEFEFLKQKVNTVANSLNSTLELINSLLKNNSGNIQEIMTNTAQATAGLNQMVNSSKSSFSGTMANLNSFSASLSDNSAKIDNIINNVENFSDSLSRAQIPTLVNQLSSTLGQLNTTIAMANSGDGTIGKLLSDSTVYKNLEAATVNLNALLEDIKDRPGRYVTISVFGNKDR